jgi:hypothetical protein
MKMTINNENTITKFYKDNKDILINYKYYFGDTIFSINIEQLNFEQKKIIKNIIDECYIQNNIIYYKKCILILNYILVKFKNTIFYYSIKINDLFSDILENNNFSDNTILTNYLKKFKDFKCCSNYDNRYQNPLFLCYKTIYYLKIILNLDCKCSETIESLYEFKNKFPEFNNEDNYLKKFMEDNFLLPHFTYFDDKNIEKFSKGIIDDNLLYIYNVMILIKEKILENQKICKRFFFHFANAIVEGEKIYILGGGSKPGTLLRVQIFNRIVVKYNFSSTLQKRKRISDNKEEKQINYQCILKSSIELLFSINDLLNDQIIDDEISDLSDD